MKTSLKNKSVVPVMMLVVAAAIAYAGTLQSPFLVSEVAEILEDPVIRDFSRVSEITRVDQIFNGSLPKLSFAINHLMGQRAPWGYHLVNLLIHLGVGLAFYWVVREWLICFRWCDSNYLKWLPLTAAGIHLLHPLNSQAVILISARPILLGSLFYLLAFGFLARFLGVYQVDPKKAKGSIDLLMIMACFALGATSDPVMVTWPFMAWIFYRFNRASAKIEGEVFALTLIPWVIYLIYQFSTPAPELLAEVANKRVSLPVLYFLTEIKVFIFYFLPKALIPIHLNLDPDFRLVAGATDWTWVIALFLIGLLFALVRAVRSPLAQWAWLWAFLIFISFYGLGLDDPVVSEPRFYLPGMGIHLLLAMALVELGTRHPVAGWLRVGVPALFMILTFGRGQDYRSEVALWQATVLTSPHKARVHYELGRAYLNSGSADQAEKTLTATLDLDPKHFRARIELGRIHLQRQDYSRALEAFKELLQQGVNDPSINYLTGYSLLKLDQSKQAVPYLEKAVKKRPGSAPWQVTLARAYHQSRRLNESLNHYRTSLQINPDQPMVHNEMGLVFWDMKSFFFADASFQKAYQQDDQYVEALNNLVSSSMLFKEYDQAMAYLNRLLKINPEDDNARQLLIAAQRFQKQEPPPSALSPRDAH